jgi:hypothetical protein
MAREVQSAVHGVLSCALCDSLCRVVQDHGPEGFTPVPPVMARAPASSRSEDYRSALQVALAIHGPVRREIRQLATQRPPGPEAALASEGNHPREAWQGAYEVSELALDGPGQFGLRRHLAQGVKDR